MSDERPDPAKTVFMPAGSVQPGQDKAADAAPPAPATPAGTDAEDAWFAGESAEAAPEPPPPEPPAPAQSGWGDPPPPAAPPPAAERTEISLPDAAPYYKAPEPVADGQGRIAIGMTLNHIFEVRRFIARGGMGEVYEGVNVNTDERVAIKVILSHLALDPSVQALFRKEARTLTRLQHPALVQYRVLAQEPTLKVLYIVTEYIDGAQLSEMIGQLHPSAEELISLTRQLASGLQAAHELGAIHRDIAPDNVLLPGGRLHDAKIIDFGIAKDLDPSTKTIVGDGFAGKLGFVAPEQFGDYDRVVGPWTDVYSLALVILALAGGRAVDMGSTLVEAIDKRRQGPDLSAAPEQLRPVLAGMLKPNPAERFRSMNEVLEALDAAVSGAGGRSAAQGGESRGGGGAPPAKSKMPLILGGGAAAVVVLGLVAFFALGHKPKGDAAAASGAAPSAATSETVRKAVETALPGVACSWIDIDGINDAPGGVAIRVSGVAGSPVAAQQAITNAARATGVPIGVVDSSNVFPVGQQTCAPLDTFRPFREPNSELGRRFTTQQSNWELSKNNPPCDGPNAKAVVNMTLGSASQNFSLIGIDKTGLVQIFADRDAFLKLQMQFPELISDKGGGNYVQTTCYNETGLVGQLLITGPGPFDLGLPDAQKTANGKQVDQAWLDGFKQKAQMGSWKTNMVWYRVIDDQPG